MDERPTKGIVFLEELIDSYWFKSRPKAVQKKILEYPPGVYKYHKNNCLILAYTEEKDGSCDKCVVYIGDEINPEGTTLGERTVFNVPFIDLTPNKEFQMQEEKLTIDEKLPQQQNLGHKKSDIIKIESQGNIYLINKKMIVAATLISNITRVWLVTNGIIEIAGNFTQEIEDALK